jgi:hypothetical protein
VRLRHALSGDRERMTRELDAVRTQDIGLSPEALLLVPRLVVKGPLRRGGDCGRFAGTVTETLRGALKRARRPWEPHSADDPLLFEDEVDAAVAVIASWLEGPSDRQWWPMLTGGADPPVWWRRAILTDAFLLPRVVARLTERKVAHAWVARLQPVEVELAIASLVRAYGLTELAARPPVARGVEHSASVASQLGAIVPEAEQPGLAPRAQLLLATALLAHRRPALVSTVRAQRALAALTQRAEEPRPPPNARGAAPAIERVHQHSRAPAVRPSRDAHPMDDIVPRADERRRPGPASAAECPRQNPATDMARVEPVKATQLATEFGGLLFLLNALLALELYGDFARPGRRLAGVSPFLLLALLGRSWFGHGFTGDPLHALLLELAGDGAAEFTPPRWSIPRSWLDPWPNARQLWIGGERRAWTLWHPAGFPLAGLRRGDRRLAARAARKAGFARVRAHSRLPRLPRDGRAAWVGSLALYLRARLKRSLGKDGVELLCRRPAFVEVDEDRLTARFALADHPLAVRIAGLDRDPGWIPTAGRIVQFAFE